MSETFLIKNIEFLSCLSFINRIEHVEIYRFLEKLIYDELPSKITHKYLALLKTEGIDSFLKTLNEKFPKKLHKEEKKNKRKNIKENMVENYVIKNKKNKQFLQELNLKIFLKTIPNKNIILKDGDIIDIIH